MTLEAQIKEIESILSTLEDNQLPLEESLTAFEKGMTLIRQCQNTLKEAEQKVQILTEEKELKEYSIHEG